MHLYIYFFFFFFRFFFLAEKGLNNFIGIEEITRDWNVHKIEQVVTAENLCSCRDPIDTAFKVSRNCGHCPCRLAGCG